MSDTLNHDSLRAILTKMEEAHRLIQAPSPAPNTLAQVEFLLVETTIGIRTLLGIHRWPEPTIEQPDLETLEEWLFADGICEATDACPVEPDGICHHGYPSWLLQLGLI